MQKGADPDAALSWSDLRSGERVLLVLSLIFFVAGVLLGPYLLCELSGRVPALSWAERVLDAVCVELLGLVLLVLWPLKVALKRWLYGSPEAPPRASRLLRWGVAAVWVVFILGAMCLLAPQLFFLLTTRETATTWALLGADGLWMIVAMLPQILATLPYTFVAARRANARRRSFSSATSRVV